MITTSNFKTLLKKLNFEHLDGSSRIYQKYYDSFDCYVKVSFEDKKIIYPEDKGMKINDRTTCNFENPENFVVFECICRLLEKGYRPEHIELEKRWNLGRNAKGGKADICVYDKDGVSMLCIIECKTDGIEYVKELNNIKNDGGQLFSYWQQERSTKWLVLYSSNLVGDIITYKTETINCSDDDVVDFQYKPGTDTYESLQDRLQRLHQKGMDEFMKEKIFYVADDYAENLIKSYTGQKREKMIAELKQTLRILKFYTNNDFAFKEVHNEELFYQNGKILVEVVQLFQKYRIIESKSLQLLGDLFEQLLNKGFKQNEGQFFTPIPITRFIWDSLPLTEIIHQDGKINIPKIIDYACGAGHFLTEGFEAINSVLSSVEGNSDSNNVWIEKKLYGVEKDYRLARVSKISLFMHGAGNGNIIFGDGLENYPEKNVNNDEFDILVANPPYSVSAFKPHLKLKNNSFELLDKISNDGSEIETLFVERISQLIKPKGIAAVILPSSILNKESNSFIGARESILKNFYIRAIVQFGSKTFGATGTNTIVLFLQKFNQPPRRTDLVTDSVSAIFRSSDISDWEDKDILEKYLLQIGVLKEDYKKFVNKEVDYTYWRTSEYFSKYVEAFEISADYVNKQKQKTFNKLSTDKQMEWYNFKFYEDTHEREWEKIYYFALVYKQTTLIITSPDDNKGQEKFLGYKWSNRKGSEGIQIIKAGGMLYDEDDRLANNTLASIVRDSFKEKKLIVPDLENDYYYLRLQDMLDFSSLYFNKALKITRVRELKDDEGLTTYKLSDKIFDISIGNRVLSTELVDDGEIPVYSANVFEVFGHINKNNLDDFSRDSVIWGIDGDWMVNCIPAGNPFYATDHCGVLRINSDEIIPKYMAIALQVEGEYEKFSRSNRASTQRIKNLSIQIPNKEKQLEIVETISKIDTQIANEQANIDKLSDDVKSKFVELFGDVIFNTKVLDILIKICK